MAKVADYSWARPAPAALVASGFTAVLRYLSHEPAKNLSPGERDALHAAGLAVGLVWESTANRALSGYAAGRADARDANAQADALGFPAAKVLFYAVDISTGPGPVTDYFRGVEDAGGRPVGVYGTYDVIEGLVGSGFVSCGWQCAAWSGTGSGSGGSYDGRRLSRHACLFQRAAAVLGGSVDENVVLMDPSPWAWHPNQPTITKESLMGRPVHCPNMNDAHANSGDAQWMLVHDGNGKERRRFLGPGEPDRFIAIGTLEGPVATLTGADADWFLGFPEVPAVHLAEQIDGGALRLVAYIRDQIVAPVAQLAGRAPADVDEAALAAAVAGPIAQAVATAVRSELPSAGLTPAQVDQLVQRVTGAVGDELAERLKS